MRKARSHTHSGVTKTALPLLLALLVIAASPGAAHEKWKELSPVHTPAGRDDHMMAFDSDRGLVVMFGGDNAGNPTWIWNGEDWRNLRISGPAVRRESALAYDSRRKVVVMFGGYDYVIDNESTWEFDGEVWTQVVPEDSPAGRSDHAMVFDSDSGLVIMFGGERVDDNTWGYDGSDWFKVNPEGNTPGGRWGHAMAYDSDRKRIVLFGGISDNAIMNDTWEWKGTRWVDVSPAAEDSPPPMRDHVMVYDSLRKRVVLFGGRDDGPEGFDQTWEWDGSSWTEINTSVNPSARHECAAAYDSWRDRTVLFGGSSEGAEDRYKDDTWWYPNNPPVIEHEPILGVFPNRPLEVSAEIVDYDEDGIEARVFYRREGDASFRSLPMQGLTGAGFAATIPAEDVLQGGLEYYIRATDPDGSGRHGFNGTRDTPHRVSVSDVGSLKVYIMPRTARKRGALWRILGTEEWLKSGTAVRNLEPGEVAVQFKTISNWRKPKSETVTIINGRRTTLTFEYVR